jgi:tRNA A37 threonylcarbamoyladenosine biosynthesis protein TsaE
LSPVFQIPTEQKLLPIAQSLAKSLDHQKIVFLEGGLGAGKTTFIRYLLEAISAQYKSPFEFQGSPTYQR